MSQDLSPEKSQVSDIQPKMAVNVCKLNKYGHYKFGKYCFYPHVDELCDMAACDSYLCEKRHPRECRYFKLNATCRFGEFCSFEHKNQAQNCKDSSQSQEELINENIQLKVKILSLESRINILEKEIEHQVHENTSIQSHVPEDETSDSEESDYHADQNVENDSTGNDIGNQLDESEHTFAEDIPISDSEIDNAETEDTKFKCGLCNFETKKKSGVKIHFTKVHRRTFLINPSYDNYILQEAENKKCIVLFKKNKASEISALSVLHSEELAN